MKWIVTCYKILKERLSVWEQLRLSALLKDTSTSVYILNNICALLSAISQLFFYFSFFITLPFTSQAGNTLQTWDIADQRPTSSPLLLIYILLNCIYVSVCFYFVCFYFLFLLFHFCFIHFAFVSAPFVIVCIISVLSVSFLTLV